VMMVILALLGLWCYFGLALIIKITNNWQDSNFKTNLFTYRKRFRL
jgi:hypothetical protein